ncbi:hypothetical protein VPHD479_0099 [Vibrio phage D479]
MMRKTIQTSLNSTLVINMTPYVCDKETVLFEQGEVLLKYTTSAETGAFKEFNLELMKGYSDEDVYLSVFVEPTGNDYWTVMLLDIVTGKYYAEGSKGKVSLIVNRELSRLSMKELRLVQSGFKSVKGISKDSLIEALEKAITNIVTVMSKHAESGNVENLDVSAFLTECGIKH